MSRDVTLTALKAGINRMRSKGGADPSCLYDLLNGWVDLDGSVKSRHGTQTTATLPAGTKGLCVLQGGFVVFSHQVTTGLPAGYSCQVLVHPTDDTQALAEIHFAAPFLGYLYVVAEFANGDVFHYWLQGGAPWQANHIYNEGDIVTPTTPNGLAYQAVRLTPAGVVWAPNIKRTVGDVVEPTSGNGYYYTVTQTLGDTPVSGVTEPVWIASNGAIVYEDTSQATTTSATGGAPGSGLGSSITDRYGNPKVRAE